MCGAKTRSGQPCPTPAMENGRCRMHGGTATGRPLIHGRYSLSHRAALAEKADRFLHDAAPADLSHELALMRALLDDYLGRFADGVPMPATEIERIMGMVERVSLLVERIVRMVNSTALTVAEVQFLTARIADLLVTYVDDPAQRLAFMDELGASLGYGRGDSSARHAGDASST
jgi:hypothetical protein